MENRKGSGEGKKGREKSRGRVYENMNGWGNEKMD